MREGILKEGRLGQFGMPYHLIVGEQSWFLNKLIQQIAIVDATNVPYEYQVIYTGISPLFDYIGEDEEVPWYKIEIDNRDRTIKTVVKQGFFKVTNKEYPKEKTQETKPAFSQDEIDILKGLIENGNAT